MNIETIPYSQYVKNIPQEGRCILGQQKNEQIIVYQAYNNSIADFAIENQYFGGNSYSYSRMSWIKPNFLWMMYRCGWAQKENQERVLGIWMRKTDFDFILQESVFSSYQENIYETHENWKNELANKTVRLQWDPDHDIYGNKQDRKAIQLGIKGDLLKKFGKEMITEIIDLTEFVKLQKKIIDSGELDMLQVPKERVYEPNSEQTKLRIGLKEQST
ncbi:DUF4291 domain-containing protein [Cyclobacterium marinum]|uniref:DUF4291 domain-containing protein n=1 Tax=Cyclobacterium marinum TaxID=104 RepID=UPI0030DAFAF8|tara:strand:- start:20754 stop:21404 length:651 start_codon:yes stop_codon:yes gene_type:complete